MFEMQTMGSLPLVDEAFAHPVVENWLAAIPVYWDDGWSEEVLVDWQDVEYVLAAQDLAVWALNERTRAQAPADDLLNRCRAA